MKIGILTFHNADNYGSVLQAYALKKFVEKVDNVTSCDVINFIPPNQEELYAIYLPNNSLKNILKNIRAFWFRKLLYNRKINFKTFRENRIGVNSAVKYYSVDDNALRDIDTVIVGSDQIWNPRSNDFSLMYFVPFFKGKKIAYAPSFGNGTVEDFDKMKLTNDVKDAMSEFDHISVREASGIQIVEKVSNMRASLVVDPTLLLQEEWDDIASDCGAKEKYIFFYAIDYNHEAIKMVQMISEKMKLPVKVIFSTNKTYRTIGKGFELVHYTSPEDFLGLIKNATLVLSSSFHGVAFSVNFRKNFFALEAHRNGELYKDQRIHNLLNNIGLESRIITIEDIVDTDFYQPIKYNDELFYSFVGKSKQYLINAIGK